ETRGRTRREGPYARADATGEVRRVGRGSEIQPERRSQTTSADRQLGRADGPPRVLHLGTQKAATLVLQIQGVTLQEPGVDGVGADFALCASSRPIGRETRTRAVKLKSVIRLAVTDWRIDVRQTCKPTGQARRQPLARVNAQEADARLAVVAHVGPQVQFRE